MVPSPDPSGKLDPAKAKSEQRRQQLEAFRAAQAAKKAASLGHKTQPPATAPARPSKSRIPTSVKTEQKDPNSQPAAKKAASASPERKPPQAKTEARPKSAAAKPKAAAALPPKGQAVAKGQSRAAKAASKSKDAPELPVESKQPAWLEAQHAFGFETPRPMESRRSTQAGEPSSLGPGFGDDGDPSVGIRWQIQVEKLRLQQWQILNKRMAAARAAQKKQAEMQLHQAAAAVVAVKEQISKERVSQAQQRNAQHAAEALAAQMPRLELYASMKEQHDTSLQQITSAVATALQQMPLVNGAICGESDETVNAAQMSQALQDLQTALDSLAPRVKPFQGKALEEGGKENSGGLQATAAAAKALAGVDGELRGHLKGNAELLGKVERELVAAESLAAQLLQLQAGK